MMKYLLPVLIVASLVIGVLAYLHMWKVKNDSESLTTDSQEANQVTGNPDDIYNNAIEASDLEINDINQEDESSTIIEDTAELTALEGAYTGNEF